MSFLAAALVLSITQRLAGAQQPSPPPEPNPIFGRFNRPVSALGLLIAVVALAVAVYSVYILHCSRAIASVGAGSSRAGRGVQGGTSRRGLGLDRAVIDTFPVLEYSAVKGLRLGKGALECAVCLNEFEDQDALRLLPKCDHVFHPDCIDEWLRFHSTCPVCRAELDPRSGESAAHPAIEPVGTVPSDESSIQVVVEENWNRDADRAQDAQEPAGADNSPNRSHRCEQRSSRTSRFARSHSTGHSLVQPGQDMNRFTLRLPAEVRKQVMDRAASAVASSSRRGNRADGEGSSSSRGRYFRRPQLLDRAFKSDRWVFTRISSLFTSTPAGSPRMPSIGFVEGGSLGRSSRTKNKPSEPAWSPV